MITHLDDAEGRDEADDLSCALLGDGPVRCWGENSAQQLGV